MLIIKTVKTLGNAALAGSTLFGAQYAFANDNGETLMTAETIMREMPVRDRYIYVSGIVEGLAYARLVKDSQTTGERDNSGMNCIYEWYFADDGETHMQIEQAFRQYPAHFPNIIVSVMINRECGE
ncbi:MAG: hypothetical protein ACE37E_11115 [Hyphomicrobiales bacterium]